MSTNAQERIEPVLQEHNAVETINPFAPPQAKVASVARKGKLLAHQKAGRVIRLMAILGVVGVIGIGAAVLIPAFADGKSPPLALLVPAAVLLSLVIGLFVVGNAVMRREAWARVVGIIYGLVSLLGFPIGTLVGGYILWQLVFCWNKTDVET